MSSPLMSDLASITSAGNSRPMLSRDADSMFWMSRYVERAEHIARLMRVSLVLLTDVGDLTHESEKQMWETILTTFRAGELPEGDGPIGQRIAQYMTFDTNNANSIAGCIARARENARAIREIISSEIWECLNAVYWNVQADDAPQRYEESPDDYYYGIMTSSMLFQGLSNQTMAHDQRWCFTQVAKYLERADVTARVIQTRFAVLSQMEQEEQPVNIHLMGVLAPAVHWKPIAACTWRIWMRIASHSF
ncbi:MAG: alpha-E domain-containing protein [Tepidisphaeraceae bacterium]